MNDADSIVPCETAPAVHEPLGARRVTTPLDGMWAFGFTDTPSESPVFNASLIVPGCWDATVDFSLRRGVGHYRRRIHIEHAGGYRICFEGVANGARVEVDGKRVADHFGPHVPFTTDDFELDVGQHEIVVHVDNRFGPHNTVLLQKCGWYCYGGIHRGVTLETVPQTRIDRAHVTTLELDKTDARLKLDVSLSQDCDRLKMTIVDDAGETVWKNVSASVDRCVTKLVDLKGIKPWSPDAPALYRLNVETPDDRISERFGIRTIRCRGRKIYLNNQEVILRGVNHHDYHPESGYTTDPLRMKRDLDLVKDLGMNFVRTSHYPKDSAFLDLCDEMGILVWEEAAGWQNGPAEMRTDLFQEQYLGLVDRMVTAHYNHPSIVTWGFLNEARSEHEELRGVFKAIATRFRDLDPYRPIAFATNRLMHNPDRMLDLVDILAPNLYNGWYLGAYGDEFPSSVADYLEALLRWFEEREVGDKPVVIGEFGAGAVPGDHRLDRRRWSEEYQADLLRDAVACYDSHPDLAGWALWLLCDTACSESEEMYRPMSHNCKGILDAHRNPKLAYHDLKEKLNHAKP